MAKTTRRKGGRVPSRVVDSPAAITAAQPMEVTDSDIARRIRAEYLEMPGMSLKAEQVQRLCGLERTVCKVMLDALVEAKFLCLKPDGGYARLSEAARVTARARRIVSPRHLRDK